MYKFTNNFDHDLMMVSQSQDLDLLKQFLGKMKLNTNMAHTYYLKIIYNDEYVLRAEDEERLHNIFGPEFEDLILDMSYDN